MNPEVIKRLRAAIREADRQAKAPTEARSITLAKLRDYANGDQFGDNFQYWRGRSPKDKDDWSEIRKLATMDDQLGPALTRFVDSTLGRDPEWTLRLGESDVTSAILDNDDADEQPAEDARSLALHLQELERAGTTWHKDAELQDALTKAMHAALWAGTSSLRVYIPNAYAHEAVEGSIPTLEEALELIHVQAVTALEGGRITDEHNRVIGHYYRYSIEDGQRSVPHVEVHTPELIEHYRIDLDDLVPLEGQSFPNPLFDPRKRRRPNYLMHTLNRKKGPALTASLLDAQDALNVEWSNARRNSDMGGFRSVVTLNADTPVDERGEPAEWTLGPDIVAELRGVPLEMTTGADGQPAPLRIATPGVEVIDPVDPEVFGKGAAEWRAMILRSMDQAHILEQFKAVSGESKAESRADFDKRVTQEAGLVADALAWVIPTVLRFAAWLTPEQDLNSLSDLTCDPRVYLDVSRGNLKVFREQVEAYGKGLVSIETVLETNPAVIDGQAELKRIRAEAEERQAKEDGDGE